MNAKTIVERDDLPAFVVIAAKANRDLFDIVKRMPRLIARAAIAVRVDGYPSSASGAQRGAPPAMPHPVIDTDDRGRTTWACGVHGCRHDRPVFVTDPALVDTIARAAAIEHWRDVHEPVLDYADRAGDAAVELATAGGWRPDPVAQAVRAIWRHLRRAATELGTAAEIARNTATPADVAELEDDGWCIVHLRCRPPLLEPVAMHRDGRRRYEQHCRWCGDFRSANGGIDPPPRLLELRETRPRKVVTPAEVDQHLADARNAKKANA